MKPLALAILVAASACSGARSYVVAPGAKVPISFSAGMRGPDGLLLQPSQKHVVGEFSFDYRAWGMLWTAISFTGDKDISDEINRQVADAGGDAVINLSVFAFNCGWNALTIVGVLPDCASVKIRGEIVKTSGAETVAAR